MEFVGILAGLISLLTAVPYAAAILKGDAKPQRAGFFIWTLLGLIFFATQLSEGATDTLWLAGAVVLSPLTIFLLSIKRGVGGFGRADKASLVFLVIGLLIWYLTDNAVTALVISLLIDFAGLILVFTKTYKMPFTEPLIPWIMGSIAGLLGLITAWGDEFSLIIFPAYLAAQASLMSATIYLRRKQLPVSPLK